MPLPVLLKEPLPLMGRENVAARVIEGQRGVVGKTHAAARADRRAAAAVADLQSAAVDGSRAGVAIGGGQRQRAVAGFGHGAGAGNQGVGEAHVVAVGVQRCRNVVGDRLELRRNILRIAAVPLQRGIAGQGDGTAAQPVAEAQHAGVDGRSAAVAVRGGQDQRATAGLGQRAAAVDGVTGGLAAGHVVHRAELLVMVLVASEASWPAVPSPNCSVPLLTVVAPL